MKVSWRTAWQGQDIVVYRDDAEADRIEAERIERIVLVHRGSGDSPGDLVQAVVEMDDAYLILAAETGFAGRVNFERQAFWAAHPCIYWVRESRAILPMRLRRGKWFLGLATPVFVRVPHAELAPWVERWPLQGPQTWEQRKWRRIERSRPFAPTEEESRSRA